MAFKFFGLIKNRGKVSAAGTALVPYGVGQQTTPTGDNGGAAKFLATAAAGLAVPTAWFVFGHYSNGSLGWDAVGVGEAAVLYAVTVKPIEQSFRWVGALREHVAKGGKVTDVLSLSGTAKTIAINAFKIVAYGTLFHLGMNAVPSLREDGFLRTTDRMASLVSLWGHSAHQVAAPKTTAAPPAAHMIGSCLYDLNSRKWIIRVPSGATGTVVDCHADAPPPPAVKMIKLRFHHNFK